MGVSPTPCCCLMTHVRVHLHVLFSGYTPRLTFCSSGLALATGALWLPHPLPAPPTPLLRDTPHIYPGGPLPQPWNLPWCFVGGLGQRFVERKQESRAEQLCNWLERELFKLIIFIGLQFLSNVVLVSTVQQSESAARAHISPPSWISSPLRSAQSPECSALHCTEGSHQPSLPERVSGGYACRSQCPSPPHLPGA